MREPIQHSPIYRAALMVLHSKCVHGAAALAEQIALHPEVAKLTIAHEERDALLEWARIIEATPGEHSPLRVAWDIRRGKAANNLRRLGLLSRQQRIISPEKDAP